MSDIDDEDLPEVVAYTKYEWDCPECQYDNRSEMIGTEEECEGCGARVRIRDTM